MPKKIGGRFTEGWGVRCRRRWCTIGRIVRKTAIAAAMVVVHAAAVRAAAAPVAPETVRVRIILLH